MQDSMAFCTQDDQVLFQIIASPAAKSLMVNFKIGEASAHLASPTIAGQDLFAKLVVGTGREANTRSFLYAPQARISCGVVSKFVLLFSW
jgi:hypothetical protein